MSLGLGLGLNLAPRKPGFSVPGLPIWSAGVRDVLAGVRNVNLIVTGESVPAGANALAPNSMTGARPYSTAALIADRLNAAGIPASSSTITGSNLQTTGALLAAYDPRITFATPADWTGNGDTLGGTLIRFINTSRMVVNFGRTFDTILYTRANAANTVVGVYIDGDPTPVQTINQTTGNTQTTTVISVPLGAHTVEVARISGGTGFLARLSVYNSALKQVMCWNAGEPGDRVAGLIGNATAYDALDSITALAPVMVLSNVGINDSGDNTPEASFKASYQTLIIRCRQTGDMQLMIPNAISAAPAGAPFINQYIADLGATNSLGVRDVRSVLGATYLIAQAAGYMSDTVHPNAVGQNLIGDLATDGLLP